MLKMSLDILSSFYVFDLIIADVCLGKFMVFNEIKL